MELRNRSEVAMRDFICVQFTINAGVKLFITTYLTSFSTFSIKCVQI